MNTPVAARHDVERDARMEQPHRPRQRHLARADTIISPRTPRRSGSTSRAASPRQSTTISASAAVGCQSTPKRIATPRPFRVSARAAQRAPRIEMGLVGKEQRAAEAAGEIGLERGDARPHRAIRSARCARRSAAGPAHRAAGATTRLPLRTVPGKRSRPPGDRRRAPASRPRSVGGALAPRRQHAARHPRAAPSPSARPRSTPRRPRRARLSSSAQARPATPAPTTMTVDWPSDNSRSFAGMTRIRFKGFSPIGCLSPDSWNGGRTPLGRYLKQSRERPCCQAARGAAPGTRWVDSPKPSLSGCAHQLLEIRHQRAGDRARPGSGARRSSPPARSRQPCRTGIPRWPWRAPPAARCAPRPPSHVSGQAHHGAAGDAVQKVHRRGRHQLAVDRPGRCWRRSIRRVALPVEHQRIVEACLQRAVLLDAADDVEARHLGVARARNRPTGGDISPW